MNKTDRIFRLLVGLLLLAGAFATPAYARTPAPQASAFAECTDVDFLVTNGTRWEVFVDVTNWSNLTRVLLILQPGQSARFSLEPGWFEFWANNYGSPSWDLSDGGAYTACTRVGVKIRPVNGVPQFKIVINY